MILPASETEWLIEIIVLARSGSYVRVNLNMDDVGVLVVGYRGDTSMERLFS